MDIRARTQTRPLFRSSPTARVAASGLLGAVTAIGMTVVLTVVALAATLLITRVRGAHLEDLAAAALSRGIVVESIAAVLLSASVLAAFSCGGYVAVRISGVRARSQALSVWLWTGSVPVGLNLAALAGGPAAYRALAGVETEKAVVALLLSSTGLALLGALLGADTAARACPATVTATAAAGPGPPQTPAAAAPIEAVPVVLPGAVPVSAQALG